MAKEKKPADAELEREIREGRKFTLAEAIGRLAGPGAMKGASPFGRKQQVEVAIEHWLSSNLLDSAGAIRTVMARRIRGSDLTLKDPGQPLRILQAYCQGILDSDYNLQEFVREVDIEWGRIVDERPHFDKEGAPPHPDDAYTIESVRKALETVLKYVPPDDSRSPS